MNLFESIYHESLLRERDNKILNFLKNENQEDLYYIYQQMGYKEFNNMVQKSEHLSEGFKDSIKKFGKTAALSGMLGLASLGAMSCSDPSSDDYEQPTTTSIENPASSSTETPAHVHSYGDWERVNDPTCSEEGLIQRKCDCGNIESEAIQATGNHDYQVVDHKDADCTEDGYDLKKCSVCGDEKKDNIVSAKGHDYGDWVVDQVADKDHIGKKHHDCNSCGNSQSVDDASEFFSHDVSGAKQIIDYDGVARSDANVNGIADDESYGDLNTGDECLMNKKARDPNSKYYGKKHKHYQQDGKKYVQWDMNDNGIFYDSRDEEEGPFKFRTKSGLLYDEENNLINN